MRPVVVTNHSCTTVSGPTRRTTWLGLRLGLGLAPTLNPSPNPNPNPNQEGHRGEQELAREVDGLPVVVLVLVGVREQRDARALHPFGRGVLARSLAHLVGEGLGVELGVELE